MSFYPMIYIAFRRQHPCPFHFHLFCFEANINIQFPHPFTDTFIIQVFSLFFSKFVCRLTYIGTFISCLFFGGKYFKSMFCWHIIGHKLVTVNRSKNLWDFLDFSLDSTSNIRTCVIRTTGFQSWTKLRWLRTNDTDKPVEL